MKNEIPEGTIDDDGLSASDAAPAEPSYGDRDDEYLLNDIGLALRLLGERR